MANVFLSCDLSAPDLGDLMSPNSDQILCCGAAIELSWCLRECSVKAADVGEAGVELKCIVLKNP